ncbi:hypothetical protein [Dongia rigui]|uniref:Uncharacterized protein n=1 Tax=Dongia rigui TaxID=940149 RepID=A0ABU5DYZ6_9PROT|nr:hypothetical protein [Dongia rigui]MDY0872515.1 hypothetical protein [Dongia rigui]
MPRASLLLSTFNAGEWSPELYGRIDLDKYRNACRRIENFVLLAQGPATRRPGTQYVASTKDDGVVRLIPFEFSTEQAYIIEAGANYFRFYMNGGRIETSPGVAYEITTPYGVNDLSGLKWAQSADVLYLVHPQFQPHKLARSGHTNWSMTPIDFSDGPYLDENVAAVNMTPAAANGSNVTLTASAATFVAGDVGRLVRIKHGSTWGWGKIITFTSATQVKIDIKSTFGGTGAVPTWRLGAWSPGTGWPSTITFHEERLFLANTKYQPQTLWASVSGAYESFAPTGTDGVTKDDHGLNFTIADDRVNAIRWMSAGKTLALGTTGGEFNLTASSLNEALTPSNVTVRRETTNGSADLRPERIGAAVIYVQRAGRKVYEMAYSFENDAFNSPELSLLARHLTLKGIKEIAYQAEPWSVIWAVRQDGALLGLTYMRGQDVVGWHQHRVAGTAAKVKSVACIPGIAQDEAWLAVERVVNGVVRRSVERMAQAFEPEDAFDKKGAFFVDGGLTFNGAGATALTPDATAAVVGSTNVPFAAAAPAFTLDDIGREIQYSYPALEGEGYHVARARITGFIDASLVTATVLAPFPGVAPIAAGAWSLGATTILGLGHLVGETVTILADGATHPTRVVAPDGSITLERPTAYAHVGLGYTSRLATMDIEAGALDGTAQGKSRRIHRVIVRLNNSLGMRVGAEEAGSEDVVFREARTAMDQSPPLFTGDKVVAFPKGWATQAVVTVLQEQPLPCTIVALIPQLTTMDG